MEHLAGRLPTPGARARSADVKHLLRLRNRIGDSLADAVVTTGKSAYRRADGIAVVPLALLGP